MVVGAEVVPTESECRPYIEKAIHELQTGEKEGEFLIVNCDYDLLILNDLLALM